MYRRSIGGVAKHWDFILLDAICLQMSFALAYLFRYQTLFTYSSRNAYRTSSIILLFLGVFISTLFDTMHNVLARGIWEELKQTLWQCALVFAGIVILLFTAKDSNHVSRIVMYTAMILYFIMGIFFRRFYRRFFLSHKKEAKGRGMLLVGDVMGTERVLEALRLHPEEGVDVRAVVRVDGDGDGDIPIHDAAEYIRNEWIDEVYIAVANSGMFPYELIAQCSEMAVTVHRQIFIDEKLHGRQWVEKIAKQPVLTTSINIPRPKQLLAKRMVDIVAGAFLSVMAIMVLLISTPIIKIVSSGPVLLKYERIGQNGRKFRMYMIRTMYMDATKRDDKVIKGIGTFLRGFSLDELPKGFNVLLGHMSLVGTRAPSIEEWEGYQYRHRAKLACKPGITGLWQVCGGGRSMSFEEATSIDTDYIADWSFELDLKIQFAPASIRKLYSVK